MLVPKLNRISSPKSKLFLFRGNNWPHASFNPRYLNRNNTVSNQLIRNQFSIISLYLIIHTFVPKSRRKTRSHPKPREHVLRDSTTINSSTMPSTVVFSTTHGTKASAALEKKENSKQHAWNWKQQNRGNFQQNRCKVLSKLGRYMFSHLGKLVLSVENFSNALIPR